MGISTVLELLSFGLIVPLMFSISNNIEYDLLLLQVDVNLEGINLIYFFLALTFSAFLLKSLFQGFIIYEQTSFTYNLKENLSNQLVNRYIYEGVLFHSMNNSSKLIQIVTREVDLFISVITATLVLISEFLIVVGLVVLLFINEPLSTFGVVIVLGSAGITFQLLTRKKILKWGIDRQFFETKRLKQLNELLEGFRSITLLQKQGFYFKRFANSNYESNKVGKLQTFVFQLPKLWLEFLGISGLLLVVVIMVLQGKEPLSIIPILGLFSASAFRLIPSINKIFTSLQSIKYGMPSIDIINSEFRNTKKPSEIQQENHIEPFENLELRSLSFQYPNSDTLIIKDLSLKIERGDFIGIFGESGSGKSTLADLITTLQSPLSGEILLNGINVNSSKIDLRGIIGYVPQKVFILDSTISENVAFGEPLDQIHKKKLQKAMAVSQLDDFVSKLAKKENSFVGERGVNFSGGQLQRIGIARALYHNSEIIIFDESTNALDKDTEKEFLKGLINLYSSGKTIIFISHNVQNFEKCNKIFQLKNGKLKHYNDERN